MQRLYALFELRERREIVGAPLPKGGKKLGIGSDNVATQPSFLIKHSTEQRTHLDLREHHLVAFLLLAAQHHPLGEKPHDEGQKKQADHQDQGPAKLSHQTRGQYLWLLLLHRSMLLSKER